MHDITDLIRIFNDCFQQSHTTQLIGGASEPLYLPKSSQNHPYHRIFFTKDYFSSGLHECAHWLIAGEARRNRVDYGYWYAPDGRTQQEQALFQRVEVKPQALEWILADASGHTFQCSFDNLNGTIEDETSFKLAVYEQKQRYREKPLWGRAERFKKALEAFYNDRLAV